MSEPRPPTFARTKIQPPRLSPRLVERSALEARLGEALATQRLTLLAAPAGFGKTAALTRQLAALPEGTALAWIACDADDDLLRFAACLVAALDPFDLPWRTSPESLAPLLAGGEAERRAATAELVNALAATDVARGLIVVDDAHRIADPAVFAGLDALVERLPAHWGVVIASRIDPPLALARWRARGELAEFRHDELRFTRDEVARLLEAQGAVRAQSAEALLDRTGGWAAGLGLALSGAGGPRAGAIDRHMFDYLTSEVLDEMPADLRGFLLRCSVLPELTEARCAHVAGDARARHWLDEVERRGLFVSLIGEDERVLVLHDLFRDCLDDRLQRELPGELPALLRRAAEGESDPSRRIGYLLRAEAWDEAAQALLEVSTGLLTEGAVDTVLRLVEQFPAPLAPRLPALQLVRAMAGWARWHWGEMQEAARHALAGFEAAGDAARAAQARAYLAIGQRGAGDRAASEASAAPLAASEPAEPARTLRGHLVVWSDFDAGRLERLPAAFATLLDRLAASDDAALWYQCVPLPPFMGLPGMTAPLTRWVEGALARAPDRPGTLRAMALALAGGLRLWAGDVDGALPELQEAEREVRWLRQPQNASNMAYGFLAVGHALRGDAAALEAACEVVLEQFRRRHHDEAAVRYAAAAFLSARWALACGHEAAARRWLESFDEHALPAERPVLVAHRRTRRAYLDWLEGDRAGAAAAFEAALPEAASADLFGHVTELRLRVASVRAAEGDLDAAARVLAPLFERHRDGRDLAAIGLAGPAIPAALAQTRWGGALG
ncbi:MAG TPA: transcriptional regulator, partial [Burkholderiaceae bacterium]